MGGLVVGGCTIRGIVVGGYVMGGLVVGGRVVGGLVVGGRDVGGLVVGGYIMGGLVEGIKREHVALCFGVREHVVEGAVGGCLFEDCGVDALFEGLILEGVGLVI